MPHNIFSAHFLRENKVVIHTYDPTSKFMGNNCSLCQGQFGLERAITLGQCCHAFYIIHIVEHSLGQSMCLEYRSPLSSKFYKMMGLRTIMPSGHEYNCQNLPLNQLPMKFLTYREWRNLLSQDVNFQCHKLFQKGGDDIDELFQITQDYKIELQARAIEDDVHRDWFYCNFRGYWIALMVFPIPHKESRKIKGWQMARGGRCRRLWRGV